MSLDIRLVANVDTGNPDLTQLPITDWINITHNVTPMWIKAECYDALYNSDGMLAEETLPIIERAINEMLPNGPEYSLLEPSNGWGSYDGALVFLMNWRDLLRLYPKGIICVSK